MDDLNETVESTESAAPATDLGLEDFATAFADDAGEAAPETPASPAETPPAEETPAPAEQPAQQYAPDPEFVRREAQREAQRIVDQQRQQEQQRQLEEYLNRLPNDAYGAWARAQQKNMAQWAQAEQAAMSKFMVEGYQSVLTSVPELKSLSAEDAKRIDVDNAESYGTLVSAMIDVAANKRAGAIAEKLAAERFEAFKADYIAEANKNQPGPAAMGSRGGNVKTRLPFDQSSGRQLLEEAFSD